MRRNMFKRITGTVVLTALLCTSVIMTSNADTISELEKQKQEAVAEKNALQSEANALKSEYNDVNSQYKTLKANVDATDAAVNQATEDLATLSQQLSESKTTQAELEETMKTHIKYMYENGSTNMLEIIIESGSISEMIERVEYLSMIMEYDRNLVEKYKQLQGDIANKSTEVAQKKTELESKSNELSSQKQELKTLVDNAGAALSDKNAEVSDAQSEVDAYDKKIEELKEYEKKLAEQDYAEQVAKAREIEAQQKAEEEQGIKEDTSQAMEGYTQDDLYLLAAIIHAEAEGEPYEGKIAVGSVVMNRVFSSKFPNTISGVVYQKNQFEPVRSGRLQMILDKGPNQDCFSAAREVLNGRRNVDKLFFWALWLAQKRGLTGGITIGKQYFY